MCKAPRIICRTQKARSKFLLLICRVYSSLQVTGVSPGPLSLFPSLPPLPTCPWPWCKQSPPSLITPPSALGQFTNPCLDLLHPPFQRNQSSTSNSQQQIILRSLSGCRGGRGEAASGAFSCLSASSWGPGWVPRHPVGTVHITLPSVFPPCWVIPRWFHSRSS